MRLPANAVADQTDGVTIDFIDAPEDENALVCRTQGKIGNTHVVSVEDPECDVLVLQRPMLRQLVEAIPHIQAYGTAVVVECDDDFESVHPKNPAFKALQPELSPNSNLLWFNLAAQLADLVTVSTPALVERYGKHGRVREIPNYVPAAYLEIQHKPNDQVTMGWPGNNRVHPTDLKVAAKAVREVMLETGCKFRAIGTPETMTDLGIADLEDQLEYVEWVPVEDYASEVAHLDVGIAPLAHSPFNRAKSWLKGIEYAALGVPFVATPLQQFKALQQLGIGELADAPSEWTRALEPLLLDATYRQERAEAGREAALGLTVEANAERWLGAWTDALSLRRGNMNG